MKKLFGLRVANNIILTSYLRARDLMQTVNWLFVANFMQFKLQISSGHDKKYFTPRHECKSKRLLLNQVRLVVHIVFAVLCPLLFCVVIYATISA